MAGLASEGTEQKTVMIDATYLKSHRKTSSLRAKKALKQRARTTLCRPSFLRPIWLLHRRASPRFP
jgi:hypothetical protein